MVALSTTDLIFRDIYFLCSNGHQERLFLLPKGFLMSGSSLTNFQAIQLRLESGEKRFQVEVFNTVIDITTSLAENVVPFTAEDRRTFLLHKTQRYSGKECERMLELLKVLVKEYTEDISNELCDQIMLLKLTLSVKLADVKTIKELVEFLLIKHAELSSTFSEVITACFLYLTLPVTVRGGSRNLFWGAKPRSPIES